MNDQPSARQRIFSTKNTIAVVLAVVAVGVGLQQQSGGPERYPNYVIFRNSYGNLVAHRDLYQRSGAEKDCFLYSPTFALAMAPFAHVPDGLGILLWCTINSLLVYLAIARVPGIEDRARLLMMFIFLPDFIIAQQNLQTNPLVASFVMLAFVCFERRETFWAALFVALAFYVKIFGLLAASLCLLYRGRPKFVAALLFWFAVLFAMPLAVISFSELVGLYENWYRLTTLMHGNASVSAASSLYSADFSLSLMNWLRAWFGLKPDAVRVQLLGLVLFAIPFLCWRAFENSRFRVLLLSSLLIWCVIFNHVAESPTYVIAMIGVGLWFVHEAKNKVTVSLLALAVVLTGLSSTDLFPRNVRNELVKPLFLKPFPCILIWGWIQFRLLTTQPAPAGLRLRLGGYTPRFVKLPHVS